MADKFPPTQAYAIIVLPNRGANLETYTFRPSTGWSQACALFWQVAVALGNAEELVRFEVRRKAVAELRQLSRVQHRDLHWGQILVEKVKAPVVTVANTRVPMDSVVYGVQATIIDLGLSRMEARDCSQKVVHWTPFENCIFDGEGASISAENMRCCSIVQGDYQFDIYRMMKAHNGDNWENFTPMTNVMVSLGLILTLADFQCQWLHYLVVKLCEAKRLRVPATSKSKNGLFSEIECEGCLVETEKVLRKHFVLKPGRREKKSAEAYDGKFTCAGDVVMWARERGWLGTAQQHAA